MLWRRPQKVHKGRKLYNSLKYQFIPFQTLISLKETQKSVFLFTSKPAVVCLFVKSCPTLFATPWTIATPSSSVHAISQARVLEWVAISFFRESSWLRDQTCVSCIVGLSLYHRASWEAKRLKAINKRLKIHTNALTTTNKNFFFNDLKSRKSGRGKEKAKIQIQYKIMA